MIFGESAGASGVMFHMLSRISSPLFSHGLMQSHPAAFPYESFDQSIKSITSRVLNYVGCKEGDYECLWLEILN